MLKIYIRNRSLSLLNTRHVPKIELATEVVELKIRVSIAYCQKIDLAALCEMDWVSKNLKVGELS